MDFGIFGITPEQVQEFRTFLANQQAAHAAGNRPGAEATGNGAANNQQSTDGAANTNNGGAGGDNRQEEPILMHNAQHNGVMCDICNVEIRGFRYKCMQCPDFDLCSKCEHKGHHAGHVMMRISFPEQARDAIRKYLSNAGGSCPPSPPHHGPHHRPPHGFGPGPVGVEDFHPFFGGRRGCGRRGGPVPHGDREESERPATAPGKHFNRSPQKTRKGKNGRVTKRCPYTMGRKEFKKWAKWMKRASTHQNRSAEAYARAAAASGNAAGASAAAGTEEPESPMDFAAVASQIQEFLNYWGVPVDVVELYDQFGNRGQPSSTGENQQSTSASAEAAAGQGQTSNTESAAANNNAGETGNVPASTGQGQQDQQPASPRSAALAENLEQMRIDETQNNAAAPPRDDSLLMDLDADNSEWTILNHSREHTPGNGATETQQQQQDGTSSPQGEQTQNQASAAAPPSSDSLNSNNNGNSSTPFGSAGSIASGNGNEQTTPNPTAPQSSFPSGLPNVPLYPVLNPPQIQQILQGVSSAVSSVVRSIPIVTDPRGPMGTNTSVTNSGQVPPNVTGGAASAPSSAEGQELDARSMKTLNQLLAMGFSNEGGYLTRLVIAKKGDLEAVLSSLFPN